MTEIRWVSEDTCDMNDTISFLFPLLWEERIKSTIYSTTWDMSAANDFDLVTYDSYILFLIDKGILEDSQERDTYSSLVNFSDEGVGIHKSLHVDINSSTSEQAEAIYKTIVSDSEDVFYGVDICLLLKDYESLQNANDDRVLLSMCLCNKLLSQGKKVFLYSTCCIPYDMVSTWIKRYTAKFKSTAVPNVYSLRGVELHTKATLLDEVKR